MATFRTVAYLRVSTVDQDVGKDKASILHLANNKKLGSVEWVEEQVPERVSREKSEIAGVLDALQAGDSLIVSELSRLGRSMLECMEILSIASQQGTSLYAVKGNWQLDGTIQSKSMAMAFAKGADIERDLISKTTKEALAARKRAGKKLGRPKGSGKSKLDKHRPEIEALMANGSAERFIAKLYGTTEASLSRWLKKQGLRRKRE